MKKQILLVSGCSHSCGAEIEGPGSYFSKYNVDHSFAGIISNDLNLKHINVAIPGCSNKVIIANTVHHINLLLKEYNPSEIFAIIGWTSFSRSEAVYKERLHSWTITSDLNPRWKDRPPVIKSMHELWKILADEEFYYNDHVLNYQLLKGFLNFNNINHFFFNAVQPLKYPKSMKNFFHANDSNNVDYVGFNMIKNDDRYFFPFEEQKSFYFCMRERYDPMKDGRWHHFTKEAHQEWAEIIKPSLKIND